LPQEQPVLLFGAMGATSDRNKGFDLLCRTLSTLAADRFSDFLAVLFGAPALEKPLPFPSHFLGRLHDDLTLALAYSAADVFVCPSRQENLPNTVLESLACGTPVAAFAVGGIPDMLEHGVNGYLAQPQDTADLARGMALLLRDAELRQRMGAVGREKVERGFALPLIVKKHMELYEGVLKIHAG
jgi:glycosyltransferase involved in cell wall biosynthesis